MNLRSDLALMLSGHASVPPCLLFRQADGLRLDGCITLLLNEGQSLALSCTADAALDHYADLLIHRLRRAAPCPVDIYFPASTAALVSRFEELVAGMTVEQAMAEVPGAAPERIWLVHEAGALASGELQLLSRLVGNFPGAGVRVVLLFGASAAARKGFESPGRRFARWDIQPPSAGEAATMLAQARQEGGESVVATLLGQLKLAPPPPPMHASAPSWMVDAPAAGVAGAAGSAPLAPLAPLAPPAAGAPRVAAPSPGPLPAWRRWLALARRRPASPAGQAHAAAPATAPVGELLVQDVVDKRGPTVLARARHGLAGLWHGSVRALQSLRRPRRQPADSPAADKPSSSSDGARP